MKNLNLLFNKTYYRNIGEKQAFDADCQTFNREICSVKFDRSHDYRSLEALGDRMKTVELVTTYPGMLVGTGYAHGTSESDNDVKIGFSFDYVTGQPYVPGSSVKGLLRCVFREQPEAAAEIVRVCTGKELTTEQIRELEEKIFDFGDIFLDAVVCAGNRNGYLMGLDNITPHSETTKNPVPLLLLKILPGVHFEFRFVLKDDILTADEKTEVFKTMLMLFGAGAKTNVGYGQLVTPQEYARLTPVVRTQAPAPAQNFGNNRSSYNGNRNNTGSSTNNNRGNARTSSSGQTEIPKRLPCPHCGQDTWVYKQNTTVIQTYCFACKRNNIDMGQAIQKYLNEH